MLGEKRQRGGIRLFAIDPNAFTICPFDASFSAPHPDRSPMKHFDFPSRFRRLYDHAVAEYAAGNRSAGTFFPEAEQAWLAGNGLTVQHLYDYAEDHHNHDGEPGFEHALGIELVRRDYFHNVQQSRSTGATLDPSNLPEKSAEIRGIGWLPRLLPKAKAKLRGELPPSLMFCCGGDRKFFREHDIVPAEFLAMVYRREHDDSAIIEWVERRSGKSRS
jgi:hypothetical protein